MKNYFRYIFSIIITLILIFMCKTNIQAKTLGDLKKELSDAEAKYNNNEADKNKTESEIQTINKKIDSLNREKSQIQNDISTLDQEIKELSSKIDNMQEDIKLIINYYQLSSSNNLYLEYVFNAANFTDFIYRLAVSEQLASYCQSKINEYNNLTNQNKQKISELASKQVSLNNLEDELSEQLSKLGNDLKNISDASIDIKSEISDLKQMINTYENTYKCSQTEDLNDCQYRYNHPNNSSSGSFVPNSSGFYMPVTSGRVNANYGYSSYYGSSFHYGIDIGVSHGTKVYSIADGIVVKITRKSSCGGNMVYIAHVVNGKKYTSSYFHLSSINVSVGQAVTKDTVIAYSGGVPSIETWDGCSTGAHLHLQMGTGLYMTDYFWYSDFQSRSFDPRNILNFPARGQYFSGR